MARPLSLSRLILVVALLCLGGGAAQARTAKLVKEGIALLNKARYAQAIDKLDEAYRDDHSLTRTLLLLGVCHLNLDHVPEALDSYERFEIEERDVAAEDRARLVTYYAEAERRLGKLPVSGPARTLLLGRIAIGRGDLLAGIQRFDEYERERGALDDKEAAALLAQRRRLVVLARARVSAGGPEAAALALPLVRMLTHLGEWQQGLAVLDELRRARRAASAGRDGAEAPTPPRAAPEPGPWTEELRSLRSALAAAQQQDGRRRELLLLLGYAELLLGEEGAAVGRYAAYLKVRQKGADDGPYEPQLRKLAAEVSAAEAAAAKQRAEEEVRQKEAAAAAKKRAEEEARVRAALAPVAKAPVPPPRQPIYKKWWLWTAVGGGLALGVAGVVLGTQLGKPSAARPTSGNVYTPEF